MKMEANTIVNTTDNGLNIGGYDGPRLATTHEFRQYLAAVASAPYIKEFHVSILANNFSPRFFKYQRINLIPKLTNSKDYCEVLGLNISKASVWLFMSVCKIYFDSQSTRLSQG
jgi:hypothetical protein